MWRKEASGGSNWAVTAMHGARMEMGARVSRTFTVSPLYLRTNTAIDARFPCRARRMVAQLFKVFAAEGYSYLCSVHTSRPFQPSRHVFASAPPAPDTNFFVLSFSLNRRKVSLIDAPAAIVKDVKKALMHAAPYGLEDGGKGSGRRKSPTSSEHPAFSEKEKARSLAESSTSIVDDYFGAAERTSRGVFTVRLKNRHSIARPKNESEQSGTFIPSLTHVFFQSHSSSLVTKTRICSLRYRI